MNILIEANNLTKKFGKKSAIEDLTFSIEEGEVFGYLGPNGAGKTTTIRILSCLISKTSGNAKIGDYEIGNKADSLKIRKMIGLVPDEVGLYDELSAYKNLDFYGKLYGCSESQRKENIERFLKMFGLWDKKEQRVGTFSKGMKKKISIARSLIHDPEVLFLDKPTANLDPESAKTVRDFIIELKKEKKTIFFNSHNLDEVQRICDRIGILKTSLLTIGTPEQLEDSIQGIKTVIQLGKIDNSIIEAVKRIDSNLSINGNKLVIDVTNPEKENPNLVRAIIERGGNIQSVSQLRPSLEEFYLKIVGDSK